MTVFLVDPWHLHLIFVTFCLSILNNSSKQKNRITTPTNWHSLTSFQTNLHHQYWITKVSPANCPAVMSKEILLYLQVAQHRHCDFSVFLTTWSDMQSDLPPSCKLDTDSAQPCLDNMFFFVLFILFLFFCYCENGSSDSHISDLNVFSFVIHLCHFLVYSLNWEIRQCVVLFPEIKYLLKNFFLSRCMAGSLNLRTSWIMLNWTADLKMEAKK